MGLESSNRDTLAIAPVDFAYNGLGQFTAIDRYQNTGGTTYGEKTQPGVDFKEFSAQ